MSLIRFPGAIVWAAVLAVPIAGAVEPLTLADGVRGQSFASDVLFRDMLAAPGGVGMADAAFFPKATEHRLIRVEVIAPYDNRATGVERWYVSHGKEAPFASYQALFQPDGHGGTDFSVLHDPGSLKKGEILTPLRAIRLVEEAGSAGVVAVFVMKVNAVGRGDGSIFLDSEARYQDAANLVIEVQAPAVEEFEQQFGTDFKKALVGKRVMAVGGARRIKIALTRNGKDTGEFYYQTRVGVASMKQLRLVP